MRNSTRVTTVNGAQRLRNLSRCYKDRSSRARSKPPAGPVLSRFATQMRVRVELREIVSRYSPRTHHPRYTGYRCDRPDGLPAGLSQSHNVTTPYPPPTGSRPGCGFGSAAVRSRRPRFPRKPWGRFRCGTSWRPLPVPVPRRHPRSSRRRAPLLPHRRPARRRRWHPGRAARRAARPPPAP